MSVHESAENTKESEIQKKHYSLEAMNVSSKLNYIDDSAKAISHDSNVRYEELQFLSHVGALDDLYLDIFSPPFQSCGDDMALLPSFESRNSQPNEDDESYAFPPASLEILRHCRSKIGAVNGRKIFGLTPLSPSPSPSLLSTNHIIELSAGSFIQATSAISNPYSSTFSALENEQAKDIQLVQDLLSCAEKVYNQQYDSARKLLEESRKRSLAQTSTIQRLVYYFSEALFYKIESETGKLMVANLPQETPFVTTAISTFHKKSPLNQVAQFASIQSVVDQVSDSRKVHIVDLDIRCGIQQMVLMQTLAAKSGQCLLRRLKITAISTNPNHNIEEAGFRLKNLADSLNLGFSFQMISLEEIQGLEKSPLGLDPEEVVVVYSAYALESMIAKPNQLEALMRAIRNINPRVMIITEAEANVNSPVFVNRFVEALFFYAAYFDCVEDCLKKDVEERMFVESKLFSPVITNIVASEGEDRMSRIVGVNVWRKFFARFGMVETELSKLAVDQANLVVDMFDRRDSCTLDLNGKCLVVGWKGTPLCSVSAWKFH